MLNSSPGPGLPFNCRQVNKMDRRIEKMSRKKVGEVFTYKYKDGNSYDILILERVLKMISSGMQSFEYLHEKFGKPSKKTGRFQKPSAPVPVVDEKKDDPVPEPDTNSSLPPKYRNKINKSRKK